VLKARAVQLLKLRRRRPYFPHHSFECRVRSSCLGDSQPTSGNGTQHAAIRASPAHPRSHSQPGCQRTGWRRAVRRGSRGSHREPARRRRCVPQFRRGRFRPCGGERPSGWAAPRAEAPPTAPRPTIALGD
jgi:hypothetical protein